MLTINHIHTADTAALRVLAMLQRGLEWLGEKHETAVVNAAYRVAEAKAAVIGKAEDKISELEDDRAELVAYGVEAKLILRDKYRAALEALDKELVAKDDAINIGLSLAAQELVAATQAYEQVLDEVDTKLGVEVTA